jgi:hypothetical protein
MQDQLGRGGHDGATPALWFVASEYSVVNILVDGSFMFFPRIKKSVKSNGWRVTDRTVDLCWKQ